MLVTTLQGDVYDDDNNKNKCMAKKLPPQHHLDHLDMKTLRVTKRIRTGNKYSDQQFLED